MTEENFIKGREQNHRKKCAHCNKMNTYKLETVEFHINNPALLEQVAIFLENSAKELRELLN